jgi:type 1 glutamine amidotransferase
MVLPLPEDCVQLLWGVPLGAQGEVQENPVAWTRSHKGGRVSYTSLGHPDDLAVPSVRTLVMNGIRWALD